MKILIKPEDILKRCLWDSYVYYVLGSEKEAEKLLKENKEIDLSERDALVIGLLKVIETDNLIHKFNTYIVDLLTNKSTNNQNTILIRKKTLDTAIDKFNDRFPKYWDPSIGYKKSLEELNSYMSDFKDSVSNLELIDVTDQFGTYSFYNSNAIKKLIKFNY